MGRIKKQEHFVPNINSKKHPIDYYSIQLCEEFFDSINLGKDSYERLYPQVESIAPLISIGRDIGWASPSLLPVDLNKKYGPWFAYRALYLVKGEFPQVKINGEGTSFNPCQECEERPCISVCPAEAVCETGNFKG